MPSALFRASLPAEWRRALGTYAAAVESSQNPQFVALDKWVTGAGATDLPALLCKQRYITRAQLSRLMAYKMLRGKWRPRLQQFVDALDEELVQETSAEAFRALAEDGDLTRALRELSKKTMKGVGPATASLVLSVFDPSVPFMGDEALLAVLGERQYDERSFLRFVALLRAKAKGLAKSHARAGDGGGGGGKKAGGDGDLDCRALEQALWCEAVAAGTQRGTGFKKKKAPKKKQAGGANAKATGKKRKAPL